MRNGSSVIAALALGLLAHSPTAFAQASGDASLTELQSAAQAAPSEPAAQRAYGLGLLRAGRFSEARQQLGRAATAARRSPESLYDIARVAFAQGDYRKAQDDCRGLSRHRGSVYFHVCNARAFLVWNRASRALESLAQAERIDANNFEYRMALGDAHRLNANLSGAADAYRSAAQVNASSAEPHVALGRLALLQNESDPAIGHFRRALTADPLSVDAMYELGRLTQTTSEGAELLSRAAIARPTSGEIQTALGESLLGRNDAEGAERAFGAAIAINGANAAAHAGLGRAKAARGDLAGAQASLERAIQIVPNSGSYVLALARNTARQGRVDDALALYRQAAGLDPRETASYIEAAKLALENNRDVLAAGFLDRVLRDKPDCGDALSIYGDVMLARSDRQGALRYFQRALATSEPFRERAHAEERVQTLTH